MNDVLEGTRYRTIRPIGRGGMGAVVEAEMVGLGKRVAVKVLHAELARNAGIVDRLRVEAQTLARLSSPYLVPVFDLGTTDRGAHFLVMELLHGRSLREEVKARGALPIAEALLYARQMLLGLHEAHQVGIVHRDVKLDNLFLCDHPDGTRSIKVVDFGVAKVLGPHARGPERPNYATEEGATVGTPRFLSPEQVTGGKVDARSDVYAVGLVLYALVTGRGPFDEHKGMMELLRAHVVEPPPAPSSVGGPAVPARLEAAILRALAKEREARFPDALAMVEELAAIEQELVRSAISAPAPAPIPQAPASPGVTTPLAVQPRVVVPALPDVTEVMVGRPISPALVVPEQLPVSPAPSPRDEERWQRVLAKRRRRAQNRPRTLARTAALSFVACAILIALALGVVRLWMVG